MLLSIISLAASLTEVSSATLGADLIRLFTLVFDGSSLDLAIHLRVITALYSPFSLNTASTGGFFFLNSEKHWDKVSFS